LDDLTGGGIVDSFSTLSLRFFNGLTLGFEGCTGDFIVEILQGVESVFVDVRGDGMLLEETGRFFELEESGEGRGHTEGVLREAELA
jgi:hypothetical protein